MSAKKKKLTHVNRVLSKEDRARHARIRAAAMQEFPPKRSTARSASPPGLPTRIRQARESRGLTWYAVAKLAGLSNQGTVRDIEHGKDVKLSYLQAVAAALNLTLELVETPAA